MSLSDKSDEEITSLLAEYGIEHGPIVNSTRKLYETKLEKAMEDAAVAASSDKTFFREEEEEVTYFTYRSPARHDLHGEMLKRRGIVEPEEDEESDQDPDPEPPLQINARTAKHSVARSKESGGCAWRLIRLLLLLAVLAAVLYYTYCYVINSEGNPSGSQ